MNITSIAVGSLLGLLLVVFGLYLVAAIIFNLRAGSRYRQRLARELDQLRLGKMLSALGIDITGYLHNERIVDITRQMDRCSACENTQRCDEKIAGGPIDADEIDFCNNEKSLQELAEDVHRRTG